MGIQRTLVLTLLAAAICSAGPARAQNCTRVGVDVTCDDGRRGILSGDAIVWADGTRSSRVNPHPSVIIGNKASVIVGQGIMAGSGKSSVLMENPATQTSCPTLEGVSYCF